MDDGLSRVIEPHEQKLPARPAPGALPCGVTDDRYEAKNDSVVHTS